MAKVYGFPSTDDRLVVQTAVQLFLATQNARTRDIMLRTARAVLDRYGIKRISFREYQVETVPDAPDVVEIKGKRILPVDQRTCPACGADIYQFLGDVRILSIQEGVWRDLVTYGCRCGAVFSKLEPVG